MRGGMLPARWAGLLVFVVAIAACGDTGTTTTEASVATTTPPASTTTRPATTTTTPPGATPVSLVALGDSFVAWSDWPEFLANDLEMLWATQVVLDDSFAAPGPAAAHEPDLLTTDETAREAFAAADILVLEPRPLVAPAAMNAFVRDACGEEGSRGCLDAALEEMQGYTQAYLDLVADLVDDDARVVVVLIGSWPVDALYPDLRNDDPESHESLSTFVYDLMRIVEGVAAGHDMLVVDIGAVFNGPDYLDPMDPAYLVADRLHLSEDGSRIVADAVLAAIDAAEGQPNWEGP